MQGLECNQQARDTIKRARREAHRRQHEYIGAEHFLASVMDESAGASATMLRALRIDTSALRALLDATVKPGSDTRSAPLLPFTSRGKKILELAMQEASSFGDSYVGSEHLLSGLLREEKGIGAQLLHHVGVTLDRVRLHVAHARRSRGES